MHFQFPPAAETKLVRATRGAIIDIIVDLRPESPTCLEGRPDGFDLDSFFGPVRVEWDHEAALTPLGSCRSSSGSIGTQNGASMASKRDPIRGTLAMTVRRADVARVNLGRSLAAERLPGVPGGRGRRLRATPRRWRCPLGSLAGLPARRQSDPATWSARRQRGLLSPPPSRRLPPIPAILQSDPGGVGSTSAKQKDGISADR